MSAERDMERALIVGLTALCAGAGFALAFLGALATHFLMAPVSLGWFFVCLLAGAAGGVGLAVAWFLIVAAVNVLRDVLGRRREVDRNLLIAAGLVGASQGGAFGAFAALSVHYLATPLSLAQALLALALAGALGAVALPAIAFLRRRER